MLIDVHAHPGTLGLVPRQPVPLIMACTHQEFQVLTPSPLIWVHDNWASGESWGCLSCVHSPGAEGGGVPEAAAAVESSLTSH